MGAITGTIGAAKMAYCIPIGSTWEVFDYAVASDTGIIAALVIGATRETVNAFDEGYRIKTSGRQIRDVQDSE